VRRLGLARALLLALPLAAGATVFLDRLDEPAPPVPDPARAALTGLCAAGARAVAVGPRGLVVRSDDGGATWSQARVPLAADLTAIRLGAGGRAIAVGHDGVVLASEDGGATWRRALDGRALARAISDRWPAGGGAAISVAREQGAAAALLDVALDDDGRGFAVGAFNVVLATEDGGGTWTPWLDRTENPRGLHLYAVRRVGADVIVAGEQGLLLRLDREGRRFLPARAPPGGTLFGLAAHGPVAVAYGLAGRALRSDDGGRTWAEAPAGVAATLVAGTALPDGTFVLAAATGELLASTDAGRTFRVVARGAPAAAIAPAGPGAILIAGAAGLRRVAVP